MCISNNFYLLESQLKGASRHRILSSNLLWYFQSCHLKLQLYYKFHFLTLTSTNLFQIHRGNYIKPTPKKFYSLLTLLLILLLIYFSSVYAISLKLSCKTKASSKKHSINLNETLSGVSSMVFNHLNVIFHPYST